MTTKNPTVRCQPILDWHVDRILRASNAYGLLTYRQAIHYATALGRREDFVMDFAAFRSGPYGIDSLQFIDWLGI